MRARLGGFVLLPRILDKGRATLAGKNGEYRPAVYAQLCVARRSLQ
jgi:hypothetical protein